VSFDAGSIIATAEIRQDKFSRDLDQMERRVRQFEEAQHRIRINPELSPQDLNRARQQFARFDTQVYQDAVQRQRAGRGMLAGMFGRVLPGGGGGATLFGGLVGSGGTVAGAATEAAIRSGMAKLDAQLSRDAATRAAGGAGGGVSIPGGSAGGFFSGLFRGIGPNILGLGTKLTAGIGLGGSLLGALPSLAGGLGGIGVGALGLGVAAGLGKSVISPISPLLQQQQQAQAALASATTPQARLAAQQQLQGVNQALKQQPAALQSIFHSLSMLQSWWQHFTASLAPALVMPLHLISSVLRGLGPDIRTVFAGAMTIVSPFIRGIGDLAHNVLPIMSQAFRAAAPLMRPFLDGLGQLLRGVLAGLVPLLKSTAPAVRVLSQALALIGRDLGQMFKDFAPAVSASSVILKALLAVVAAILPIVGQLAALFAKTLAPVFKVFAGTIHALLPVLTIIGKVLAELAGAILGDLASAFGALATLLKDIAPSLNILANALGSVFKILENSGVFAILGNSVEAVVKPLAILINTLVGGLAPVLPQLISLISTLASTALKILVQALIILLPILTELVKDALIPLLPAIRVLVPIINAMAVALGTGLGAVLRIIGPILARLAPFILAVVAAIKIWTIAQAILNIALDANPIGLIAIAIAGLIIGITLLATHWKRVWTDVKNWAMDAWNFLTHGWGQYLVPGLTAIRYAVEFVRDHWRAAWGAIKSAGLDAWNFLHNDVFAPIYNFVTKTLPSAFSSAVSAIGSAWNAVKNVVRAPVAWVVDNVIDGLISAFDWISSKVGGPNIKPIHPFGLATGGLIPGYGGGDKHLALLEGGEAVVSKETTAAHANELRSWGVPGFQGGGLIGGVGHFFSSLFHVAGAGGRALAALFTGNSTALSNALKGMLPSGTHGAVGALGGLLAAIPTTLIKSVVSDLIGSFGGGGAGGKGGFGGHGVVPTGPIQAYARRLVGTVWPGVAEWMAFADIVARESGWNVSATNPTSGAYGIPQALPASKMASAGADWRTNPFTQLRWMVGYIRSRWVDPLRADFNERTQHWYDKGGWWLRQGHYPNGTGRPEAVLTPSQSSAFIDLAAAAAGKGTGGDMGALLAKLDRLIKAVEATPRATAGGMAEALNRAGRRSAYSSAYGG
jgi:hypothetical protein